MTLTDPVLHINRLAEVTRHLVSGPTKIGEALSAVVELEGVALRYIPEMASLFDCAEIEAVRGFFRALNTPGADAMLFNEHIQQGVCRDHDADGSYSA